MQFLKTLFWVVLAVVAVIFSIRNWIPVEINLWGGLAADVKLPFLLFVAFLLGFLPTFILHRATRWRLRRRLDNSQRALDEARASTGVSADQAEVIQPGAGTIDPAPIGPTTSLL